MKYFILGGGGFIGSHYAQYLATRNQEVRILDDFSTGRRNNLEGVEYRTCSIEEGIEWCDYIIHLAASVGVEYVTDNVVGCMYNNLELEQKVFTVNAIHQKPLLFASTSEVYGNSDQVPFRETQDLTIGNPSQGRWGYACSKLMGEFLALHSPFPAVVVRFFNVTGPRQLPDYGMVLPKFIKAGLEGSPIEVYGDGMAVRCFCHVEDAVVALDALITDDDCYNQVFNIGNPTNNITVKALANKVLRMTNGRSTIIMKDFETVFKKNPTDILKRVPSISKIQDKTGWMPSKDMDDIIGDMIEHEIRPDNDN